MSRYNFRETEAKWQRLWRDERLFEVTADPARPKYYVLEMFPYPSGKLHVGHVRNYTMGDLVARYRRAQGFNVLHPMGWDAFGLPAENAAIAEHTHPAVWTHENIATMRAQLQRMGFAYDWSREIATCHPEYYRHEQKMFLDFLAQDLAYRKESWVNWDPVENTVLANEQVIDGRGWRSGAVVEKRLLSQWFLRITAFTEELLDAIGGLERWPERVRLMQERWIGRSEGARVTFAIAGRDERIEVFTTRQDTLFGASFLALSPNHPLAQRLAEDDPGLAAFIAECNRMGTSEAAIETAEKRGRATGLEAVHPFDDSRRIPVYVANFVLMEYGTGAIFGCPAHDQRDLEFARKYGLPVIPVVLPPGADPARFAIGEEPFVEDGTLFNSDFLDGLSVAEAKRAAGERLEALGRGERTIAYRLRDWGVSRQRYWGCPIPVIHCAGCGIVPVPESDLPVRLPEDVSFDRARQPARPSPDLEICRLPALRPAGAARDRHLRHVLRIVLVFSALLLGPRARRLRPRGGRVLDAGRPVHRRRRARRAASALFPLLYPGLEAVRLSRLRRAVRRAVHPGHGVPPDLPRRNRRMALPRGGRDRRRGPARRFRRPPGQRRAQRKDVEIEKERRRPRCDRRHLRRRHRPALPAVGQPARARPRMDRDRHRGHLALCQPVVADGERAAGAAAAAGRRRRRPICRRPWRRCAARRTSTIAAVTDDLDKVPLQPRGRPHSRADQRARGAAGRRARRPRRCCARGSKPWRGFSAR